MQYLIRTYDLRTRASEILFSNTIMICSHRIALVHFLRINAVIVNVKLDTNIIIYW